jgi:hypothetical protein
MLPAGYPNAMHDIDITPGVIGAAIKVHRKLGQAIFAVKSLSV